MVEKLVSWSNLSKMALEWVCKLFISTEVQKMNLCSCIRCFLHSFAHQCLPVCKAGCGNLRPHYTSLASSPVETLMRLNLCSEIRDILVSRGMGMSANYFGIIITTIDRILSVVTFPLLTQWFLANCDGITVPVHEKENISNVEKRQISPSQKSPLNMPCVSAFFLRVLLIDRWHKNVSCVIS